jgi:hypothetical protein
MGRGANTSRSAAAPVSLRDVLDKRRGDGNATTWAGSHGNSDAPGLREPDRILDDGTRQWLDEDGRLHREGGPAEITPDGERRWYRHGKLHREDGPAVVSPDGYEAWYRDGFFHREDGPAVVEPDGYEAWYRDGLPHRDDGPAIVYRDGGEEWYRNGRRQRVRDGRP